MNSLVSSIHRVSAQPVANNHIELINLAFGEHGEQSVSTAVAAAGLSSTCLRTARGAVAACYMHWQGKTLDNWVRIAQRCKPKVVVSRLAWDETGQRLCMEATGGGITSEQQSGTYQVMVCRLRILIAWPVEVGGGVVDLECTLPPCIVPSPSAAIEATVLCVAGSREIDVLSRLFSFTTLMRSSNYYLRLVLSLSRIVRDARVVRLPAPGSGREGSAIAEDAFAFQEELASYMFSHANRYRAAMDQNSVPTFVFDGSGPQVDSESIASTRSCGSSAPSSSPSGTAPFGRNPSVL